jgi:hypothetical protein
MHMRVWGVLLLLCVTPDVWLRGPLPRNGAVSHSQQPHGQIYGHDHRSSSPRPQSRLVRSRCSRISEWRDPSVPRSGRAVRLRGLIKLHRPVRDRRAIRIDSRPVVPSQRPAWDRLELPVPVPTGHRCAALRCRGQLVQPHGVDEHEHSNRVGPVKRPIEHRRQHGFHLALTRAMTSRSTCRINEDIYDRDVAPRPGNLRVPG